MLSSINKQLYSKSWNNYQDVDADPGPPLCISAPKMHRPLFRLFSEYKTAKTMLYKANQSDCWMQAHPPLCLLCMSTGQHVKRSRLSRLQGLQRFLGEVFVALVFFSIRVQLIYPFAEFIVAFRFSTDGETLPVFNWSTVQYTRHFHLDRFIFIKFRFWLIEKLQ